MKSGGKRRFAVASVVGTLVLFVALVAYTQEDPYALLKKPKELHSFFPDTAVGRSDFIPASAGSGHEPYEDQGTSSNAYGFYNVYANGSAFRDIVEDQIKTLEATGALARLRKVFIIAIGPDNADVRIDNPKFELLKTAASADESFTLHSVWSFCREPAHHDDIVLYFHDKGSHHPSTTNTKFRKALDCFVLNPGCLDALNAGFDTCGMRASPVPHLHYPGNMWWAKCSHIKDLVNPRSFEDDEAFVERFNKMLKSIGAVSCVEPYLGSGRYFAESWIGTAPNFKPADCFDVSIDTDYIYNYWVPSSKLRKGGYCPNFRDEWSVGATQGRKWGGTCGNASMLVYPDLFKDKRLSPVSKPGLCTSLKYARARSKLWYGAEPELQIRWRALFGEVAKN